MLATGPSNSWYLRATVSAVSGDIPANNNAWPSIGTRNRAKIEDETFITN